MTERCRTTLAVILLGCALAAPARAEYCPSCMEDALLQHGNDTYGAIEKAWKQYSEVAAFMKKLEASGDEAQKAKFLPLWQKVQAEWRPLEKMAREYASPSFKAYLDQYQTFLKRRVDQARARLHKETDLYRRLDKTTLGAQRRGLINDMLGFRKESEQLEHEFYGDLGLAAITSAEKTFEIGVERAIKGVEASIGGDANRKLWSAALLGALKSGEASAPAVASTLETVIHAREFQKAQEQNNRLRSFAAAVHAASDSGLAFINLLITTEAVTLRPLVKAGAQKSTMYLHIVALGLDNVMIDKSFERLAQAEERMRSVELSEHSWQQRIKISGEQLRRADRRLGFLNTEMAQQQRIAGLYRQIQAQTP